MDTSGFYKNIGIGTKIEILYAPSFVKAPLFSLYKESHTEYEYPCDEWYWFNSREEAGIFFSSSILIENGGSNT